MKFKTIILTTLATMTFTLGQASAEPERPVLEAAQKATPRQRMMAADFLRTAYPGLQKDMYSQLKANYSELEHGWVDAALATWRQHPGEVMGIAEEVREKFGPRMKSLRMKVRGEMEASYPDFRNRLGAVLSEHGVAARWVAFMEGYDPELLDQVRSKVKETRPGWYPGKFRKMWSEAEPGETPVFDKMLGFVKKNPNMGPKFVSKAVEMTRLRSPKLAEDAVKYFVADHGRLREALASEFPGAREKMVAVIEAHDPDLPGEVARFVRSKTSSIRADFRANLDHELPGFENKVEALINERYPELKSQLLARLR